MTDNNLVNNYESYFRVAEKKDVLKDAWSFPNGEAQILFPETILGCIQDFKNEHNKEDFLVNFLADFDVYSGYFKLHSNPLTFICILSLMLDLEGISAKLKDPGCELSISPDQFSLQRYLKFFKLAFFQNLYDFVAGRKLSKILIVYGMKKRILDIRTSGTEIYLSFYQ